MTAEQVSLAALILLLFPMFYFLVASLTFFLSKFQDPVVTRMLRGLFGTWLLGVAVLGTLGALAFANAGRLQVALLLGLVAALAAAARGWFLRRIDVEIRRRDAGDPLAIRRLRRLHLGGIAYNAVQLAAFLVAIPGLFPAA